MPVCPNISHWKEKWPCIKTSQKANHHKIAEVLSQTNVVTIKYFLIFKVQTTLICCKACVDKNRHQYNMQAEANKTISLVVHTQNLTKNQNNTDQVNLRFINSVQIKKSQILFVFYFYDEHISTKLDKIQESVSKSAIYKTKCIRYCNTSTTVSVRKPSFQVTSTALARRTRKTIKNKLYCNTYR